MKNPIIKYAFWDAIFTSLYIGLIALFLFTVPKMFVEDKGVFGAMLMLLLLVFSASLTGSLVFGRPIFWYLDGKKKEAVQMFAYTLGFFFLIICFFFAFLVFVR